MKHAATSSFWKHYEALPGAVRKLADKNFELLKQDAAHPSLHFKLVDRHVWSARIGVHYRALALKNADSFTWFWIGSHADYDRMIG